MSTNLVSKVYGRLTVLKRIGTKWDTALWLCGCYCGNYTEATTGDLRRQDRPKRTCGKCYDHIKYASEYNAWRRMYQRCHNPDNPDYSNYGGRGIKVCHEWRVDFFAFLIHIGLKPDEYDISVDRIDNNKGYEPGNVRWADRWTQNCNKRTSNFKILRKFRSTGK